MRKSGAVAALCGAVALTMALVASATGFVGNGGVPTARASHTSAIARSATVPEFGYLESVSPTQRSLRIGYSGPSGPNACALVDPSATVAETATSVTVTMHQQDISPPMPAGCQQNQGRILGTLVVELKAPLAGRKVLGLILVNGALSSAARGSWNPQPSPYSPLRVHSVIGLSPADAEAMLTFEDHSAPCCNYRQQQLRIEVRHTRQPECPLPMVVGQQPAPGAVIRKQGSRVVLLVAPALRPCGAASCPYRGC